MAKPLTIDTIHSPDDGGYYAEIYDASGREVYCTPTVDSRIHASGLAVAWIGKQDDNPSFRYGEDI